jgi:hypothetical protein
MLPAKVQKTSSADRFFGKSYPRAVGKLDEDYKLIKSDDRPQLPNAALIRMNHPLDRYSVFANLLIHARFANLDPLSSLLVESFAISFEIVHHEVLAV